jgi:hypothetical protein
LRDGWGSSQQQQCWDGQQEQGGSPELLRHSSPPSGRNAQMWHKITGDLVAIRPMVVPAGLVPYSAALDKPCGGEAAGAASLWT